MVALIVAASIVPTGVRLLLALDAGCSSTRRCPGDEVAAIREAIEEFAGRGVVGYHELRTRRAGSRRYVDLHVQFRRGTSLEDAHRTAHELQERIASRLGEDRRADPSRAGGPGATRRGAAPVPARTGRGRGAQIRLIAAHTATASVTPA